MDNKILIKFEFEIGYDKLQFFLDVNIKVNNDLHLSLVQVKARQYTFAKVRQ